MRRIQVQDHTHFAAPALAGVAMPAFPTAGLARSIARKTVEASADAIVCGCALVSRKDVVRAVAAGAVSFDQVQGATGCSTVCGGCRADVQDVVAAVTRGAESVDEFRDADCDRAFERAFLFGDQLAEPTPESNREKLSRQAVVAQMFAGLAVLLLVCIAGVVAVPAAWASGVIGASTASFCGLLVALALWIDIQCSHDEWRRIFFEETADETAGPRSVDIRVRAKQRLSFGQWLQYKFTLRLDYLLNDIWRAAAHSVRKSLLRRGYRAARTWSPLYQPCWEHVDRQLAELVIESSLMLGLSETWTDEASGHTHGRFVYSDWLCPASPQFKNEAVHIDRFEVVVDLDRRRAVSAAVNGREIGAGEDALVLADLCVSINFHTILHAYANRACVPNHPDPVLARAAIYTMAMNGQSWHAGYFATTVATNFKRVLGLNARRGIFPHGSGPMMKQLMRYSRTGAFLMAARKVTLDVLREHRIDVDAEAFFLMSVMHSIDHAVIPAAVDPTNLYSRLLGYRGMEWIRVLVQEPLRPILADTRISVHKTGWVADLYQRLYAIDPWYADRVDYCIRY